MRIEIVPADFDLAEHRSGFIEVLDSYASEPIGNGQPLSSEVRERLIPALLDHPTSLVLLAVAEGRPVGTAVCFLGLSTFWARPLLNIHDLAILPEWRGKGIGRRLLLAVEVEARQRGCCKLTLEVRGDNRRARGLYESFGFGEEKAGEAGGMRFLTKTIGGLAADS